MDQTLQSLASFVDEEMRRREGQKMMGEASVAFLEEEQRRRNLLSLPPQRDVYGYRLESIFVDRSSRPRTFASYKLAEDRYEQGKRVSVEIPFQFGVHGWDCTWGTGVSVVVSASSRTPKRLKRELRTLASLAAASGLKLKARSSDGRVHVVERLVLQDVDGAEDDDDEDEEDESEQLSEQLNSVVSLTSDVNAIIMSQGYSSATSYESALITNELDPKDIYNTASLSEKLFELLLSSGFLTISLL
jgi:hypothetical protein